MKISSINGSPHGKQGATDVLVEAFLEGARSGTAETSSLFLAEKPLSACRGCHACWTTSLGKCVIHDGLAEILASIEGSDLIVLASPLQFLAISGNLKVFIDRLTSTGGNPHEDRKEGGVAKPSLGMIMSCGFPKQEQFRSTSLWVADLAALLGRELVLEAYAGGGRSLLEAGARAEAKVAGYLETLRSAGRKVAAALPLAPEEYALLKGGF